MTADGSEPGEREEARGQEAPSADMHRSKTPNPSIQPTYQESPTDSTPSPNTHSSPSGPSLRWAAHPENTAACTPLPRAPSPWPCSVTCPRTTSSPLSLCAAWARSSQADHSPLQGPTANHSRSRCRLTHTCRSCRRAADRLRCGSHWRLRRRRARRALGCWQLRSWGG